MRCIIKTLKSKILSIVLSCTLVLGLLVSGVSAYVVPEEYNVTIGDLFEDYVSGFKEYQIDFATPYLEEYMSLYSYCCVRAYRNSSGIYSFYFFFSDVSFFIDSDYYFLTTNAGYYQIMYFSSSSQTVTRGARVHPQSGVSPNGGYWCTPLITPVNNDLEFYINFECSIYGDSYAPNLDMSLEPTPSDSRIFEVWKSVDYPESSNPLEYINVRLDGYVDLLRVPHQKIRFDYIDQDGNSLYKVFTESDFHDIQYDDSEDVYTFYIFPYLISSYEFTITSATYYSNIVEWAEKTIELDLTYNQGTIYPLPQDWNSVYTVNQFFQSRSNGTINTGVTLLALSDSGYFWIDNNRKVCHQVFDVKALFIPYFMNSDLLSINLETLFQLYEQYDVIFTGVQPSQFNTLIPTLDYNDLYVYYSQNGFYPALQKLQEYYVFYHNLDYQHSYSDYTWTLSTDNVGFIVTRSFLLKRTLTALGDIDNRLLEFETNLVGEDSLGASLQTKLDNILSLEHDFFTDVSNFFQKLEYNINGLSLGNIERYLEDIWSATVGERNFNYTDLLPEPLKSIFLYFRGWFISSTQYMQDFIDVSNSSLYGDDLMTLPFEASVVPVLPFEPGTPTPIPIPTLEAGLIEVGGD